MPVKGFATDPGKLRAMSKTAWDWVIVVSGRAAALAPTRWRRRGATKSGACCPAATDDAAHEVEIAMRNRIARTCAALLVLLAAAGCALPEPVAHREAPRIWDVRAQRFVDERELVDALARARYALLGERHDNPLHHAVRARLIAAIAATGNRPAVVFEQFAREHDDALRLAQDAGGDAETLADAGRLDRTSWEWPLHKPLLDAALAVPLPVRAGNLSRRELRDDLAGRIAAQTGPAWIVRLRATRWTEAQEKQLEDDIVDGHCGKLPDTVVPRIALAQRARDAAMAQALVDHATPTGAILIAGNGHVRADVGVPVYLRAPGLAGSDGNVVGVGFVEAGSRDANAPGFPRRAAAAHPGFDYLWFTPGVARDDPCSRMRAPPQAPG